MLSGPLAITDSDVPIGGDVSVGSEDGADDDDPCTGEPPLISSDASDIEGTAESLEESNVRGAKTVDVIVRGGRGGGMARGTGEAASAERLSGATSALRSSARVGVDWLSEACS